MKRYGETTPVTRWLQQARRRSGLHQHQLAARLDINQGRISEWENGKPIPPKMLERLRQALSEK